MSGKKKNQPMPASSAGLLRFFEDETEGVKIKPEVIIITAMGLVVASISLNLVFPAPATSSSSASAIFLSLLFR